MKGKIFTIIMLLWLFSSEGLSQSNITTWRSYSIKDMRSNEEHSYACTFKVYPDERIDWIQSDVTFSFEITSTEGGFPDEGDGTVTYILVKEGRSGKVILQRRGGSTLLTLDLSEGGGVGAYLRFDVSNE